MLHTEFSSTLDCWKVESRLNIIIEVSLGSRERHASQRVLRAEEDSYTQNFVDPGELCKVRVVGRWGPAPAPDGCI